MIKHKPGNSSQPLDTAIIESTDLWFNLFVLPDGCVALEDFYKSYDADTRINSWLVGPQVKQYRRSVNVVAHTSLLTAPRSMHRIIPLHLRCWMMAYGLRFMSMKLGLKTMKAWAMTGWCSVLPMHWWPALLCVRMAVWLIWKQLTWCSGSVRVHLVITHNYTTATFTLMNCWQKRVVGLRGNTAARTLIRFAKWNTPWLKISGYFAKRWMYPSPTAVIERK